MLSGVGPAHHLEEHKIPVIHNLEGVGENMADHNRIPLLYETIPGYSLNGLQASIPRLAYNLYRGLVHKDGPLTRPIIEAAAYFRIPVSSQESFHNKFMIYLCAYMYCSTGRSVQC